MQNMLSSLRWTKKSVAKSAAAFFPIARNQICASTGAFSQHQLATTHSSGANNSADHKDATDAAEQATTVSIPTKCEPTEKLLAEMAKDKSIEMKVKRIQKEFAIYEYFASRVPTEFLDKHWISLLKIDSVLDRVKYFWFMGLNEIKATIDEYNKKENEAWKKAREAVEAKKIASGGIGYGTGLCQQMYSPLGHRYQRPYTAWNAISLTLDDMPRLLFDCQYVPTLKPQEYGKVRKSAVNAYFENGEVRYPFPTAYVNVNPTNPLTRNLLRREIVPSKLHETKFLRFVPNTYSNNPFHDPHESDPREQVIYLSRYAEEMIDGPLIHKAYVIPLTFDRDRETIGAVRRDNYRTMVLPIRKYLKWQTGPIYVPFPTLIKILHDVAANGGDWAYALQKHISKRHFKTNEERRKQMNEWRYQQMMDERKEKFKLADLITDSMGHGDELAAQDPERNPTMAATLTEYADKLSFF